nr:immunoglobulin heavy chain junction region [Mus musculus]MBK4196667.1 immunoglobulin heavy chain junction region [Mus musculus]MBK4196668.1 immunoglobulin heavy chain junction region [Mus musculus]MBK4196672.1 immunoglobulin heavy chain junction region [Mus musculus]MBK4196673.1 immunoglobulin heavy chain junction region [Mus musculus]
CARDSYAMDYW